MSDILTLAEAANYLRTTERRLVTLARAHQIAYVKEGRNYTFRLVALEAYAEANEIPAVAPNAFGLTDRSAARLARTS